MSLQTSGNGDRREILATLYGVEVARQMLEVMAEEDDLSVSGFISPTTLTRSNRREITFFVNGRWVQDVPLTTALLQAYHTLLMVGRYPMALVFLELPPEEVDVNVHPAKAEVRFRSPDRMFSGVQRAVRRALLAYTPIPQVYGPSTWPVEAEAAATPAWAESADSASAPAAPANPWSAPAATELDQPPLPGERLPLLRLVGQVGAAYLVAEGPDGLYLIDQHAAHERVLFERFMARGVQPIPGQTLLEPVVVQLSPQNAQALGNQLPILGKLGFQVEILRPRYISGTGNPEFAIEQRPSGSRSGAGRRFSEEDETPLQAEVEARLIARVCKRAAVKAGANLSLDEQRAFVRDL